MFIHVLVAEMTKEHFMLILSLICIFFPGINLSESKSFFWEAYAPVGSCNINAPSAPWNTIKSITFRGIFQLLDAYKQRSFWCSKQSQKYVKWSRTGAGGRAPRSFKQQFLNLQADKR